MSRLAVELIDVSVTYGMTTALSDVSLDVSTGEILAVIGPSGSGKSTLLRAVAGLEPLASGQIRLAGTDMAAVPTHKRDIGFMFQDHALFPHLDVAGNIEFGLKMAGIEHEVARARVGEMLDLVELGALSSRKVDELSGGEAQRVALARALAPSPKVLMLDEPFGSLDRVLREQLVVEIGELLRTVGQTAIHVTHDQPEAFAIADRVAILNSGEIAQVGVPETLWRNPASSFVARFLGHSNIWSSRTGGYDLVPQSGLRLSDNTSPEVIVAEVVNAVFSEGRWRHTATSERGVVEFDHPSRLNGSVSLEVDVAQIRHLES